MMEKEVSKGKEASARMPSVEKILGRFDFVNGAYLSDQSMCMLRAFASNIAERNMDGPGLFEVWDKSLAFACDVFDRKSTPPSSAIINVAWSRDGGVGFDRVIDCLGLPEEVSRQAKAAKEKALLEYDAREAIRFNPR